MGRGYAHAVIAETSGQAGSMGEKWLAAATNQAVAADVEAIYTMISDQITARGPACWASGRCCNFKGAGHRLYVTGLEAAYAVLHAGRGLTVAEVEAAQGRGDCPYLVENLCSIHTAKGVGCRVYFCDRGARDWQEELSERALEMMRRVHVRHGVAYEYGEWTRMLLEVLAGQERGAGAGAG